jgi:branched-chain amino acid transport system ATP-binding protein
LSLLLVESVNVHFGGLHALRDVDLDVTSGSVTGLIGPNGAGKTTLFNVICGLQPATKGKVVFDDKDVTAQRSHERARLGIGRTFQRLEVFGSLSAEQNVLVAAEIRKRWSSDKTDPRQVTREVLDLVGIAHIADHRVDSMPTGLARLVELARALAVKPRLLLLDEPSSGLNERESDAFADLLGHLVGTGLGILLVEHDVELVMRVCARIHVLDFGKIIAAGAPAEIQANEAVQAAYLGAAEPAGATR